MSAIRRQSQRPRSGILIALGVLVGVVGLGFAVMFGSKLLLNERQVVTQASLPIAAPLPPDTIPAPTSDAPDADAAATTAPSAPPPSTEDTPAAATTSTGEDEAATGAKWVVADRPPTSSLAATTEPPPAEPSQPPAEAMAVDRLPVPTGEDRQAGWKKVRDIFATEFQNASDKPAMIALAKDLPQRGKEEQDAVAKFALLYESRALLLDAADLTLALEATDELAAWFEVDLWTLKL